MNEALNNCLRTCQECKQNSNISDYVLFRKPNSFYGSDHPRVMLLGHSPTVRTSQEADVVLKMDKKSQPLYKYITGIILEPLGIPLEQVYCTNMIKCQTSIPPQDIKKINFIDLAFSKCSELFEFEVKEIQPKLIISFSETVLKQICKKYMSNKLNMKECFGDLFYLDINGFQVQYIPVVHLPKKNSFVEQHYFPKQTQKLERLKSILD